jgi:hypothetical protein
MKLAIYVVFENLFRRSLGSDILRREMSDSSLSYPFRVVHAALVAGLTLIATFAPFAYASAGASLTLKVEASHGLPGLHHSALMRFLAAHMADAGLANWRFEPAERDGPAPDRVEWSFKLNPYAGGEVRRFARSLFDELSFYAHRPITIEARLYLNGEYQTLVEKQAIIDGGPDDPHLAEAVASITQNLLGPSGAYRAIDTGHRLTSQAR